MSPFLHLSIHNKLLLAFGSIALLTSAVGFTAVTINFEIETDISQIRQAAIEKAEAVAEMSESLLEMKLHTEESLARLNLTSSSTNLDSSKPLQEIATAIKNFEGAEVAAHKDSVAAIKLAKYEGNADEIQKENEEILLLDEIDSKFGRLKTIIQTDFLGSHASMNGPDDARHLSLGNNFDQVSVLVEKYETNTRGQLAKEVANIQAALSHANSILFAFALLVLILGSVLAWFISRTVSRPIGILSTFAQQIGRGHLDATVNLRSRDEFGLLAKTFNQMTKDLQNKTVSKDYVESILKSMVNTLIVVRPDHTIQSVNAAAVQLLDYPESELVGGSMDRVLQSPLGKSKALLDEALEKGFVSNADVLYQAKDLRLIPMAFSASILRDPAGKISGLVCVAQDISERKEAERKLEQANRQLLETSRQAGMAEVATSVLHNVGNVLNSVNVSSALISDKIQKSKVGNFKKAVALIEQHRADLPTFFSLDEKGQKLPDYLSKLATNLEYEQKEVLQETASLTANILHIKEIVATQQSYARISGIAESLSITDLLEDAIRINVGAMERHGIKIVREYSDVPPALVERHKALQILVNLISNAKQACDMSVQGDKQILLRIAQESNRIKVSVIDTGVGIAAENLTRIFGYGFTTKKEGHGFGLHSSALAAKEMGGALSVRSEGLGKGATFMLDLPVASESKL